VALSRAGAGTRGVYTYTRGLNTCIRLEYMYARGSYTYIRGVYTWRCQGYTTDLRDRWTIEVCIVTFAGTVMWVRDVGQGCGSGLALPPWVDRGSEDTSSACVATNLLWSEVLHTGGRRGPFLLSCTLGLLSILSKPPGSRARQAHK